jgi:uncharacterized protein (DUF4415 family)
MMMNEENITNTWIDPDDAPKLTPEWFAGAELRDGDKVIRRGRPRSDASKQPVSLRLDRDVIAWFKSEGEGWQTRMNKALREAAGL